MYTIDQRNCPKSRTFRRQNNQLFFSSTSLAHFVRYFGTMASYTYTKLTDLACLVFCYNCRTMWKCQNKVKILGKGGCVQHHFSKKRAVTHCFY